MTNIYTNKYNLEITLFNEARSEKEAAEKSLRQLSNIQVNLSNDFTRTSLLLKDTEE